MNDWSGGKLRPLLKKVNILLISLFHFLLGSLPVARTQSVADLQLPAVGRNIPESGLGGAARRTDHQVPEGRRVSLLYRRPSSFFMLLFSGKARPDA